MSEVQKWLHFSMQFQGTFRGQSKRLNQESVTTWDNVILTVQIINVKKQKALISGIGTSLFHGRQYVCLFDGTIEKYKVELTNKIIYNIHW